MGFSCLRRVKDEVLRVAGRYDLDVKVVAASWLRVPNDPRITLEVVEVGGALDAADDWIVERVGPGTSSSRTTSWRALPRE